MMPTAISEKIRSRQESLNASIRMAQQTIRQAFLEQGAAVVEAERAMTQELREEFRQGFEREALLGTLATVRAQAELVVQDFRRARAIFEGDETIVPTIEAHLRAAEEFLTWVQGIEARASAPMPPFDESRLSPAPTGLTADGYIGISEARARVGKRS